MLGKVFFLLLLFLLHEYSQFLSNAEAGGGKSLKKLEAAFLAPTTPVGAKFARSASFELRLFGLC